MRTTVSQYAQALHELAQEKSTSEQVMIAEDFFAFLRRKGEAKKLSRIVTKMQQLQDAQSERQRVTVTTAFPVTDELVLVLEMFAKKMFESSSVILDMRTNKTLLGGIVMKTDNHMLDASIARKIKQVSNLLTT